MSSSRRKITKSISCVTRGSPYNIAATLPLTKYRIPNLSIGSTKSSIRSGSGMTEYASHFVHYLLLRPVGMLALHKGTFVPAHRPVEPMRGPPPLLRRHPPKNLDLLRSGLFVGQHD